MTESFENPFVSANTFIILLNFDTMIEVILIIYNMG